MSDIEPVRKFKHNEVMNKWPNKALFCSRLGVVKIFLAHPTLFAPYVTS